MKLHHGTHRRFILDTVSCDRCDGSFLTPSLSLFWQKTRQRQSALPGITRLTGRNTGMGSDVFTLLTSLLSFFTSATVHSSSGFCAVLLTAHASCGNKWLAGLRMCGSRLRKSCFRLDGVSLSWYFHRFPLAHVLLHVCLHSPRSELPSQTEVIDSIGVVEITPILCQNEY